MFKFILGVDQTGAAKPNGTTKPLPSALIVNEQGRQQFFLPLKLDDLNYKSITDLLKNLNVGWSDDIHWSQLLVMADCVLGLPQKIVQDENPLQLLQNKMIQASKIKTNGLKAGEDFFQKEFSEAYKDIKETPIRKQEKNLGCLSVFKNKPFQKNIQTGSFRIWKNLGENSGFQNFNIFPYENHPQKAFLCEAYPSYARKILEKEALEIEQFETVSKDHQDAVLIALLGLKYFDPSLKIKHAKEGYILTTEY